MHFLECSKVSLVRTASVVCVLLFAWWGLSGGSEVPSGGGKGSPCPLPLDLFKADGLRDKDGSGAGIGVREVLA